MYSCGTSLQFKLSPRVAHACAMHCCWCSLFRKEYIRWCSTAVGVPQNTAPAAVQATPTHSMAGETHGRSTICTISWKGYCGCGLGKLLDSSKFLDPEFFSTGTIFYHSHKCLHYILKEVTCAVKKKKKSLKIQRNLKSEYFLFPLQECEEWEWERREDSKRAWVKFN